MKYKPEESGRMRNRFPVISPAGGSIAKQTRRRREIAPDAERAGLT